MLKQLFRDLRIGLAALAFQQFVLHVQLKSNPSSSLKQKLSHPAVRLTPIIIAGLALTSVSLMKFFFIINFGLLQYAVLKDDKNFIQNVSSLQLVVSAVVVPHSIFGLLAKSHSEQSQRIQSQNIAQILTSKAYSTPTLEKDQTMQLPSENKSDGTGDLKPNS